VLAYNVFIFRDFLCASPKIGLHALSRIPVCYHFGNHPNFMSMVFLEVIDITNVLLLVHVQWVDLRDRLDNLEKRKFLTPVGLELRPLGHPARS
jgi:hypothetical protein